ncbi:MAG: hypothetical protein HQL42_13240 [Alphaproteobacteria bacterium]|nr:hypothetical protein [Alphaproteobacteria bacterium]
MYATTIWQPHASLIAIGAKPYETRDYPPPAKLIGQRIAIHAAVRPAGKMQASMMRGPHWDIATAITHALHDAGHLGNWGDLPHGAVLCTAILSGGYQCGEPSIAYRGLDCWTVHQCASGSHSINSNIPIDPFGDYSPGRWAWLLRDVQQLPRPVPAKGKQGWWTWSPDEADLTPCGGCGKLMRPDDIAFRYAGGDPEMCAACAPTPEQAEAERAECRAIKGETCDVAGDCESAKLCYPGADHG